MTNYDADQDAGAAYPPTEEQSRPRGKLKIFFGAAAGVGKTYAMLQAAHERQATGVDVVIGCIEPHHRPETDALLAHLEQLSPLWVDYGDTVLREFDLDAALQRHPGLILVDELAHTNAPSLRHARRWQDVEELLAAGIHVYTTVNVQHLESLNDLIAQITNVTVRETIPDRILEAADEVELLDLSPDELLQRLHDGKIYQPEQANFARHNFFRKGNLMALRELALLRTADRVDAQMRRYMHEHAIPKTWPTQERLLIGVGPSQLSARLVRATQRMATRLHATWLAVYVETPAHIRLSDVQREHVLHNLRLAEKLGAETVTLSGTRVSEELVRYARQRNVSKIVVGKPERPRWRELLFGSVVDEVVRTSGEIDVYVISGEQSEKPLSRPLLLQRTSHWSGYAKALFIVALFTGIATLLFNALDLSNLAMLYLLGVTLVAYRYGRGPSFLAALLSVAAFDFFYVPPYISFEVADFPYIITFIVMLTVAFLISTLTVQIRTQADAARRRERRTSALYAMARDMVSKRGLENLTQVAIHHISDVFASETAIFLADLQGHLIMQPGSTLPQATTDQEQVAVQWVFEHRQIAGANTDTLPSVSATYLPLKATRGGIGVLAVKPADTQRLLDPEQLHLLETFANQTSVAIERAYLADEAQTATLQVETERLRNSLLSSVSHDLRTPLASIKGAASTLLDDEVLLEPAARRDLAVTISEESDRLNRLLSNLLEMTRLEAGAVHVHKEWQPLEEVVGAALNWLDARLAGRPLTVNLPPDLPLVPLDGVLIEQVLINLIENAIKYTPPATPIEICARRDGATVIVTIADHGMGLPPDAIEQLFNKFYRARPKETPSGSGLGLAIARGMIEAHGGHIWAENRQDGTGAIFSFTLPLEGEPPTLNAT
ncbi:MAG: sensor histidine kinase KdpD [Chloroflexi bacterium]|nr:sensor histidine kinase KdpD [Chloroflexota bacterium]